MTYDRQAVPGDEVDGAYTPAVRTIVVIGIGAGDPDYLTMQAVKALNRVDAFFILEKGDQLDDLIGLRQQILDRYVEKPSYRVVTARDPKRDRETPAYPGAVQDWRHRRADVCEQLIRDELGEDESAAFLVWGDPSLYDSTLDILEEISSRGTVAFDYSVVPGISSVSALAAKHRVMLNRIGRPVQVTTGRRLSEAWPSGVDDVVVMLDSRNAFNGYAEDDVDIYWGAYVGTPDELLASGRLSDVAGQIEELRRDARERKGWVMDCYLLRRTEPGADERAAGADTEGGAQDAAERGPGADTDERVARAAAERGAGADTDERRTGAG